jgi:phosphoheptose isomerase
MKILEFIKKLCTIKKQANYVINLFYSSLKNDNTIFIHGNGGSASDSKHLSTEFLVRLRPNTNRKPYKIINLGLNLA